MASKSTNRIMIVAGELSGDQYGAALATALKELSPEIELLGMGGKHMAESGVKLLVDNSSMAVVGAWEVVAKIEVIVHAFSRLRQELKNNPPDLLVLIDYPDFNLFLAQVAKRCGVKILYYISPQVWAWRKGRTKKIARLVDKIAVILPFEEPLYQQVGANVEFVGHPLLEMVDIKPLQDRGEDRIVGLLPGSRHNEINTLLKPLLETAQLLLKSNPDLKFLMPVAANLDYQEIERLVAPYSLPLTLVREQAHYVMKKSTLIIVASGTATLEAALIGAPMIVIYKVAWLTGVLVDLLVDTPYIALANVVAGKEIVPELIQEQAEPPIIAARAQELLNDTNKLAAMKAELAKAREKLGTPGASKRVARIALNLL